MAVVMVIGACGDEPATSPTDPGAVETTGGSTTAPSTTIAETTTTAAAGTTSTATAETTTTAAAETTTTVGVSAADALSGFFAAAETLDADIRAAADLFNAGVDPEAGTLDPVAAMAIGGLDPSAVAALVPGGLPSELEVAVIGVFADLDSRIAALQGGVQALEWSWEGALVCLGNGAAPAARFPDDLERARSLASRAPVPSAAPDSAAAGMAATRMAYIQGANRCCDACGGMTYDSEIQIDWETSILAPGEGNVPFEAVFEGGAWIVEFPGAG